jgi:BACON domain-containing protein
MARVPSSLCVFSISPTSADLPFNGGSGSVNVTAPSGCSWAAASRVSWITLTGATSGTGNGTVTYTASGGGDGLTGLLIIAAQHFPYTWGRKHAVTPSHLRMRHGLLLAEPEPLASKLQAAVVGALQAMPVGSRLRKINHDSGNGGLTYSVAANSDPARSGTLTVAGQTVTIDQVTTSCSYTVSPTSRSFDSTGGSGSIGITTLNGCPWTVTSDSSWIIRPPLLHRRWFHGRCMAARGPSTLVCRSPAIRGLNAGVEGRMAITRSCSRFLPLLL